jgi:hypothetical protein
MRDLTYVSLFGTSDHNQEMDFMRQLIVFAWYHSPFKENLEFYLGNDSSPLCIWSW